MKLLFAALTLLFVFSSAKAQSKPIDFTAVAMDGTKVELSKLRGKVIVLNLWFINCPNCVQEIKLLNSIVDEYKGNSDVVFLAPAASNKSDLQKFLAKNPFKYQVLPNSQLLIISKFGTPDKKGEINMPFPMHYVLGRDGIATANAQGIKGVEVVRSELKRLLAKRP